MEGVVGPIGDQPEFAARFEGLGDVIEEFGLEEAALVVFGFRPGVGEEHEDAGGAGGGEAGEEFAGVLVDHFEVGLGGFLQVGVEDFEAVEVDFAP